MNSFAAVLPWTKQDISMHQGSGLFVILYILYWVYMFCYMAGVEGDALFVKENETDFN